MKDRFHKTTDLYYAAYLKAAGVPFYDTDRYEGRVTFLFEDVDGLDEIRRSYYNRTGKIAALTFVDEFKALRSLIYEND